MTKKTTPATLCPCGSGKDFAACCGRFLDGGQTPETPEELMRSRYSAYVLWRENWIRATWAPETYPAALMEGADKVKWLGLTVKNAALQTPTEGTVEFVARGRTREGAFRMHEISRFEKRDGVWVYVDGTFPDKS